MLLYVDEMLAEIDAIREYVEIIQLKFEAGRPSDELLLDARGLIKRMEYLNSVLPEGCSLENGLRHAGFMIHYLEKDDLESCRGDVRDIIMFDLPEGAASIRSWANELTYSDRELRDELRVLIRTGQFDSAIRKAFVVLKDRICRQYELPNEVDGSQLVNDLFGSKSEYFPEMNAAEKQAHRDLFAGLFGLVRNRYAHNNYEASLTELDTVISGVNYCLTLINGFKKEPLRGDSE